MKAHPLRPLLLGCLGGLLLACGGVSSRPIAAGPADAGDGDGGGGGAAGISFIFEEDGEPRSGGSGVTAAVIAVGQSGVQWVRVTSVYDPGGASLTFEVTSISPPLSVGTYTCGPGVSMRQAATAPPGAFTGPGNNGRCTLTLTALGTRPGERVAGSFSGVLRNESGAMKIISEGSFTIPLGPPAAP